MRRDSLAARGVGEAAFLLLSRGALAEARSAWPISILRRLEWDGPSELSKRPGVLCGSHGPI